MLRILTVTAAVLLASAAHAQTMSTNNRVMTDCSGTITTGGTAQTIIPATTGVSGFYIVNLDTTEPLWLNIGGAATAGNQGSAPIVAGAATTYSGTGSFYSGYGYNAIVSVLAATTGHKFTCKRW